MDRLCTERFPSAVVALLLFSEVLAGQNQWKKHQDPERYSVEAPEGWTLFPSSEKGWIHLMGNQGEDVVIWPVFVPGLMDARLAPVTLLRLAVACPYQADWGAPELAAPNAARVRGRSQNNAAVAVFVWIPTSQGSAGIFYLTGARESDFRAKQADLLRILRSFHIVGPPSAAAAAASIQYTSFTDPNEGAFTLEVPAGWQSSGGLARFSAEDYRVGVETVSPDGNIRVVLGDPSAPKFIEPTSPYFPEGSVYAPWGFPMLVRRFMTGALYCREYVQTHAPQICPNLQIIDVKDRPDLLSEAMQNPDLAGFPAVSIGDTSFRCGEPSQPKVGYCAAVTAGGPPTWRLYDLRGYLATAGQAPLAASVMEHVGRSFQASPQWVMRQLQIEGATTQIIHEATSRIGAMGAQSGEGRESARDEMARRRSNANLGIVDVLDQETGRHTTVESGSNYYWVDNRGTILGTNTDSVPNVDFRKLIELP